MYQGLHCLMLGLALRRVLVLAIKVPVYRLLICIRDLLVFPPRIIRLGRLRPRLPAPHLNELRLFLCLLCRHLLEAFLVRILRVDQLVLPHRQGCRALDDVWLYATYDLHASFLGDVVQSFLLYALGEGTCTTSLVNVVLGRQSIRYQLILPFKLQIIKTWSHIIVILNHR